MAPTSTSRSTIPQFGVATLYGELYYAKNLDRAKLIADPLGPLGRDARELGFYVAALLQIGDLATVGARYDTYNPDRDSTNSAKPLVPTDLSYGTLALVAVVRHAERPRRSSSTTTTRTTAAATSWAGPRT